MKEIQAKAGPDPCGVHAAFNFMSEGSMSMGQPGIENLSVPPEGAAAAAGAQPGSQTAGQAGGEAPGASAAGLPGQGNQQRGRGPGR